MRCDVKKEIKKTTICFFSPFLSFYFGKFFSLQSHWKLFLYASSDFFEVYSWYIFIKRKHKKKNLFLNQTARVFNRFFFSSLFVETLEWNGFFPYPEFKVLCTNLQQKWVETPGASIIAATARINSKRRFRKACSPVGPQERFPQCYYHCLNHGGILPGILSSAQLRKMRPNVHVKVLLQGRNQREVVLETWDQNIVSYPSVWHW